jgi:hypothetical protein
MMTDIRINLDAFSVVINVAPGGGGTITTDMGPGFEQIESLLLAMACAGIDLTGHAMLEALETAYDACLNNEGDEETPQTYAVTGTLVRTYTFDIDEDVEATDEDSALYEALAQIDIPEECAVNTWASGPYIHRTEDE